MRKLIYIAMLSIFICGCHSNTQVSKKYRNDFSVGFIVTTEKKRDSNIYYLDDNLQLLYKEKVKLPRLGSTFTQPMYQNNQMFLVPNGLYLDKNERKIASLDFKNGQVKEYTVPKFNILNVAVMDDRIYTLNNQNSKEYITLTNKDGKIINEITDNHNIITAIGCIKDKVYTFKSNTDNDTVESYIDIYDKNLHLIKTINISQFGTSHLKYVTDNKKLYFANRTENSQSIVSLDLNTNELNEIKLKNKEPNELELYKNYLIVSHGTTSNPQDKHITLVDLNTKECKVVDTEEPVLCMEVSKDYLYTIDANDGIMHIVKYDINGMKEMKRVEYKYDAQLPYYPSVLFKNTIDQ